MPETPLQVPYIDAFIFRIGEQRRYSKYTLRNYKKSVEEWYLWLSQNEFFKGDITKIEKRLARDYVAELARKHARTTLHNKISAIHIVKRGNRNWYTLRHNPLLPYRIRM